MTTYIKVYHCIAGNFWGRKLVISQFESHLQNSEFWGHTHLDDQFNILQKFSLQNSHFLQIRESFHPGKFPYYTVLYSLVPSQALLLAFNGVLHDTCTCSYWL